MDASEAFRAAMEHVAGPPDHEWTMADAAEISDGFFAWVDAQVGKIEAQIGDDLENPDRRGIATSRIVLDAAMKLKAMGSRDLAMSLIALQQIHNANVTPEQLCNSFCRAMFSSPGFYGMFRAYLSDMFAE